MGWRENITLAITMRRRLDELLDLDAPGDDVEIAAFVVNQLAILPHSGIGFLCGRSTDWLRPAIARVQLRAQRDPAVAARVRALERQLRAALRNKPGTEDS